MVSFSRYFSWPGKYLLFKYTKRIQGEKRMSTWKIMRLRCGHTVRDAVNFLGVAHAKEDYQVTFWSYAIWNEQYKILVDTGVNREDEQPWYTKVPNIVKDEERLDRQLEDHLGWKPEEVDAVIFTHLHYDHTGYAYLFKNEIRRKGPCVSPGTQ